MLRSGIAAAAIGALVLIAAAAAAVPLNPRTIKRLVEYEKIDEWVWIADDAAERGVGVLPPRGPVITPERPSAEVRVVALLVNFADQPDPTPDAVHKFDRSLFRKGEKGLGSVARFYSESSGGAITINGAVFGWYALPGKKGEYAGSQAGMGKYPMNAQKLVEDALAVAGDVPYSEFDAWGPSGGPDGVVDILLVVHSDRGAEITGSTDDLWSHTGMLPHAVDVGGVRVESYMLAPQEGQVGLLSYEIARLLGVPDLHDPRYVWEGLGAWSLMGTGLWAGAAGEVPGALDAYSRIQLGISVPIDVSEDLVGVDLGCGRLPPPVFRLFPGGQPGPEYFLVECRERFGFDYRLPGEGVLIYHVDEGSRDNRYPSCGPGAPHPRVAVLQADGLCELEAGGAAEANDLWARVQTDERFEPRDFDDFSNPNSYDYQGRRTGVAVRNFQASDGGLRADLSVHTERPADRTADLAVAVEKEQGKDVIGVRIRVPVEGTVNFLVRSLGGETLWQADYEFDRFGDHSIRLDPQVIGADKPGVYFFEARTPDWWRVERFEIP